MLGLNSAKPSLERITLTDQRIWVYPGGRFDIAAGRIDIRVLVTLRYLAEAFGRVDGVVAPVRPSPLRSPRSDLGARLRPRG